MTAGALIMEWSPNYTFVLAAAIGSVVNWVQKAVNKEAPWNPLEYWFKNYPGRSGASFTVLALSIWGFWGSDLVLKSTMETLVYTGFMTGLGVDAVINKGRRQPKGDSNGQVSGNYGGTDPQ